MELLTHDFYYDLPEELIAQTPAEPRDHSRLMVYSREADSVTHAHFYDLPKFLRKGDLLVINNTKVIPARLFAHMEGRESTFEILLLRRLDYTRWECIMRPARKARKGSVLKVSDELSAVVEDVGDYGVRTVRFVFDGVFEDILDRVGNMPLPPYIHAKLADKTRYNTVYSKTDGSAAAPTAGLHFTPELMEKVKEGGEDMFFDGVDKLEGGVEIKDHHDHRMVMAFAVAATVCARPVTICGCESIDKSYPAFFEDLKKLGGKFEITED